MPDLSRHGPAALYACAIIPLLPPTTSNRRVPGQLQWYDGKRVDNGGRNNNHAADAMQEDMGGSLVSPGWLLDQPWYSYLLDIQ